MVLPLSRALFDGGTFGGILIVVLPHSRGPCLVVVLLEGSGPWFFLTLEGLVFELHTVGYEVYGGGGLEVYLHAERDDVHGGGSLVVEFMRWGMKFTTVGAL